MSVTPYKQVKIYPTPEVSDLLFYEIRHSDLPSFNTPPEYGTAHPDVRKYPHHKLVFVEPEKGNGEQKWWYAADRQNQDAYNYQISYPYRGDTDFPRYSRTYLVPAGEDTPVAEGSPDPVHPTAILVAQKSEPADQPLTGTYRKVVRVYDTIPGAGDATASGSSQTSGGYVVDRPLGDLGHQRLVWKLTLPKALAESVVAAGRQNLVSCPIPGYTDLKLVSERLVSSEEDSQSATIERVYKKEQSATAPVKKKIRMVQAEPPDRFLDYVQREEEDLEVLPEIVGGVPVPDDPDDWAGTGGGQQSATVQTIVEMQTVLEGGKRKIVTRYPTPGSLRRMAWNRELNQLLATDTFAVKRVDAEAWVANATNVAVNQTAEIEPYNREWSIITRATFPVIAAGDPVLNPHLSYWTNRNHSWPRVLTSFEPLTVATRDSAGASSYSVQKYVGKYKEPWSGPTRTRIRRWWQKARPGDIGSPNTGFPYVQYLNPTGIVIDWPTLRVVVEESLHDVLTFSASIGSNHPDYMPATFNKTLDATVLQTPGFPATHTAAIDWPASMVVDFDVEPYMGGYMCTHVEVYRPDNQIILSP